MTITDQTDSRRFDFVLNSARVTDPSGIEDRIGRIAVECGADVRIHMAQDGAQLVTLAKRAMAEPGHAIVAGGGDGSINAVASALIEGTRPLGVLPLGTFNHFAKDLKIPLAIDDAIRTVFTGEVARVDVGEINGHVFLNNSSVGFYPELVHLREKQQQNGSSKWTAFARALATVMRRYSYSRVRLRHARSGQSESAYDTSFLFVGNNRYAITGLDMGSRAGLDGGALWVYVAPQANARSLVALGFRALINRLRTTDIDIFETTELSVSTRPRRLRVSADGEVIRLDSPLRYRIRPKALSVVVPRIEAPAGKAAAGEVAARDRSS